MVHIRPRSWSFCLGLLWHVCIDEGGFSSFVYCSVQRLGGGREKKKQGRKGAATSGEIATRRGAVAHHVPYVTSHHGNTI